VKNCSDFFGAKLKRKEGFEREGAVSHCYVVVFGVWKCSKESLISGLEGFVVNSDQIPQTLYFFFSYLLGLNFGVFLCLIMAVFCVVMNPTTSLTRRITRHHVWVPPCGTLPHSLMFHFSHSLYCLFI